MGGLEVEDGELLDVHLDLTGTIVNVPPTANAGANQVVECTSPDPEDVTLDGTQSDDPG